MIKNGTGNGAIRTVCKWVLIPNNTLALKIRLDIQPKGGNHVKNNGRSKRK
jgi:hypothetical protein